MDADWLANPGAAQRLRLDLWIPEEALVDKVKKVAVENKEVVGELGKNVLPQAVED